MRTILISLLGLCLLLLCLHAGETPAASVPAEILDMAMEPPRINVAPGPEYSDESRDYGMVIGMNRTPRGRLWAAWVAGGDSDLGYFVAASSDDEGRTWSAPRLEIDPPDAPTGLRRRIRVGNSLSGTRGAYRFAFSRRCTPQPGLEENHERRSPAGDRQAAFDFA